MSAAGDRIRSLRRERGLSQHDLASPGITYTYISRIEAGTREPSEKALRALARKLGTTAHYLESGNPHARCRTAAETLSATWNDAQAALPKVAA